MMTQQWNWDNEGQFNEWVKAFLWTSWKRYKEETHY